MSRTGPLPGLDEAPDTNRRPGDFWLLWCSQGLSSLGSAISDIAYPLLVLSSGGTPLDAGLIGLASTGSRLLLRLVAGLIVDVLPRRALLLWCDIGRAAAVGGLASLLVADSASLGLILAVLFIEGSLSVVFFSAERAVLRSLVSRERLTEAIARNQIYFQFAAIAGPPLGGALFAIGRTIPFAVDAISYAVSASLIICIRTSLARTGDRARASVGDAFAGWRVVWRDTVGRAALIQLGGMNMVLAALPLVVILKARSAGVSGAVIGALFSVGGVGGIAGALLVPWLRGRWRDWVIVRAAGWLWPVALVPISLHYNPWLTALTLLLVSLTIAPVQSIIFGYQTASAPEDLQGRVHSAVNLITNGLTPLAPPVVGYLATNWGVASLGAALILAAVFGAVHASLSGPLRGLSSSPIG